MDKLIEQNTFNAVCHNVIRSIAPNGTPVRTGALRRSIKDKPVQTNSYRVTWTKKYGLFLDTGTKPHNIPHAFGRPLPFGTFGRFDGKFHPGSKVHMGFVSGKTGIAMQIARELKNQINSGNMGEGFMVKSITGS